MASSLFQNRQQMQPQNQQGNNMLAMLNNIKSMGNPQALAQNMMMNNPQFKQFFEMNKNKPIEQIAQENGIDLNMFKSLLGR